ncbi:leucine-rich repeat protein [Treponema zioleckii]|uniref:leucine-rich repeat protein n=1 Tax=Treponema zioleckii TaxID=331680 RepID=UPI00168B6C37|nr:leucine-rich repeat protein [Treponema zioleckii]
MKKILLALSLAIATAFSCFAATPDKYFKYDLCPLDILSKIGMKGDYVYITNFYEDKMDEDNITEVEIPKEIEGLSVIGACISGSRNITKISIPESVLYINASEYDFWNDDSLKLIEYTGTATKPLYFEGGRAVFIGSVPQKGRKVELQSLIVKNCGDKFEISKDWIFDKNYANEFKYDFPYYTTPLFINDDIKELSFEKGVTVVWNLSEDRGHPHIVKIEKIILPSTIKTIPCQAFKNLKKLTEVVFPKNVKIEYPNEGWNNEAFLYCRSLGLKAKQAIKASGYTGEF